MHEFSVCQALLEEVQKLAHDHGACSVARIVVRVGPLCGVEPGLLERAFDCARIGSVAAEATLSIERSPVRVRCRQCRRDSDAAANRLVCAHCGGWRTDLVSGDELVLERLEFQRSDDAATIALH